MIFFYNVLFKVAGSYHGHFFQFLSYVSWVSGNWAVGNWVQLIKSFYLFKSLPVFLLIHVFDLPTSSKFSYEIWSAGQDVQKMHRNQLSDVL